MSSSNDAIHNDGIREKVLQEIISTEKAYFQQLETLEKFFIRPMKEKGILPPGVHSCMFGDLTSIRRMNRELLQELAYDNADVGLAFHRLAPFLKVYYSYANNYQAAIDVLQEHESTDAAFKRWLAGAESRPEVQTKLASLMITPVQRIPRYRLLLEELLKFTPQEHLHFESISGAFEEVSRVADHINRKMREGDSLQRMWLIQKALKGGTPSLMTPGRYLIREGPLNKVSHKGNGFSSRLFFLFTDMIMYTKLPMRALSTRNGSLLSPVRTTLPDYRPDTLECCCVMPLRQCVATSVFGCGQNGVTFRLRCREEDLLLFSSDSTEGQAWLSDLKEAITKAAENRKTLRKESSAKKPLRKVALKKWIQDEEIQLQELKATTSDSEYSPRSLRSMQVMQSPPEWSQPKPQSSASSFKAQLMLAQECLTPPRRWRAKRKGGSEGNETSHPCADRNGVELRRGTKNSLLGKRGRPFSLTMAPLFKKTKVESENIFNGKGTVREGLRGTELK